MTTVVNNPGNNGDSSGAGALVAIVIAIIVIVLFFVYILPAIRSGGAAPQPNSGINVNVQLPTGGGNNAAPASGSSNAAY